jgi:hypothetical protein
MKSNIYSTDFEEYEAHRLGAESRFEKKRVTCGNSRIFPTFSTNVQFYFRTFNLFFHFRFWPIKERYLTSSTYGKRLVQGVGKLLQEISQSNAKMEANQFNRPNTFNTDTFSTRPATVSVAAFTKPGTAVNNNNNDRGSNDVGGKDQNEVMETYRYFKTFNILFNFHFFFDHFD